MGFRRSPFPHDSHWVITLVPGIEKEKDNWDRAALLVWVRLWVMFARARTALLVLARTSVIVAAAIRIAVAQATIVIAARRLTSFAI
jgi:hypothetical protein